MITKFFYFADILEWIVALRDKRYTTYGIRARLKRSGLLGSKRSRYLNLYPIHMVIDLVVVQEKSMSYGASEGSILYDCFFLV